MTDSASKYVKFVSDQARKANALGAGLFGTQPSPGFVKRPAEDTPKK
jgi:hypothetical protein